MQTIVRTAEFVRSNGNQVEVLLRVKHGDNPNFAFLISLDRLHPYYRCVSCVCCAWQCMGSELTALHELLHSTDSCSAALEKSSIKSRETPWWGDHI